MVVLTLTMMIGNVLGLAPSSVTIASFHSWCAERAIMVPKLRVGVCDEGGLGVFAVTDIAADEIVVDMPLG